MEAVRKRPAMYIGSTDKHGLHHILYEAIDNSVDEAMAGFCDHITITLTKDGAIAVQDNGRGIPVDIHKQTKKSAMEVAMTNLHAGGKFDNEVYKTSGGLHGIGIKCTNALSEWMETTSYRDGYEYVQKYNRGIPEKDVKKLRKTELRGTKHVFKPDPQIFDIVEFDINTIINRCREHAYLTAGLRFTIIDNREHKDTSDNTNDNNDNVANVPIYELYFEDGIKSFVKHLCLDSNLVGETFYTKDSYTSSGEKKKKETIVVEIAIQYTTTMNENIQCYTNNIINPEGGTHIAGFRSALTNVINDYITAQGEQKGGNENLSGDDIREGLTAVISVKIAEPQFEGQTKIKLNNPEARSAVYQVLKKNLALFLAEKPSTARAISKRAILAYKARVAAKAARDAVVRKGIFETGSLPGKLADCSSNKPEECELYIVEGPSAGGSAKQARNRRTQAVLPLKGKPMNSQKYRIDRVLNNPETKNMVSALGCGIGKTLNINKLRYHKIVILSDADVDGLHITTLILTLLHRFFRPLIEYGFVYIAQPPLFKVEIGKERYYIISQEEKDKFIAEKQAEGYNPIVNRFKGLGEMTAEQLEVSTMSPKTRTLKQITIKDSQLANKTFDMLMGSEVLPRRRFIQQHAKYATLDV